jgi:hypothetical protein
MTTPRKLTIAAVALLVCGLVFRAAVETAVRQVGNDSSGIRDQRQWHCHGKHPGE